MASDRPIFDSSLFARLQPESACVLIVEDEAIVAEDLSDQLSEMGYRVCGIADNCEQALAMVEAHKPHIVMMDIVIKGPLDGIATAEKIARHFQTPVIFATAYSDPATLTRAARTAPYGYITKPYQGRDVRAAIEVALYKNTLERRLKDSERWFSATLRCVADGVIATDTEGVIQFANPSAEKLLGKSMDALVGKSIVDELVFAAHETCPHPFQSLQTLKQRTDAEIFFGLRLHKKGDYVLNVDFSVAVIRDASGEPIGMVTALRDIQERVIAEQELKLSEERFRTAFEFAPVGMALVSMEGRFIQYNQALASLLGYDAKTLDTLTQGDITHVDDHPLEEKQLRSLLMGEVHCLQFEKRLLAKDGQAIWVFASLSLLRKSDIPVCYLYQLHDISERKQFEAQMTHLAHFDSLTGLSNRARLMEDIERNIGMTQRSGQSFALLFCDLDHFKHVNDSMGHEAGDQLLQTIAKRLRDSLRDTDTVARLGGDEFVVLVSNVLTPEYAGHVAQKIKEQISQEITIAGQQVRVGGSLGVSIFPGDGKDARTLLRNADSALYEAKNRGRNGVQFYRSELTQQIESQLNLTTELRNALERNEFALYFQPIVDLQTRKMCAVEALVRWRHPSKGVLCPDDFLPCVEQAGLMVQLGNWVIQDACRARAAWRTLESGTVPININVSCSQFVGNALVPALKAAMESHQLTPADVVIELTEQLMLDDSAHNLHILNEMQLMGIPIALDDFGVGYSSLSYLVRFAPSKVKIDRSFVTSIGSSARDDTLVESILTLGTKLAMSTVAEGIENPSQLEFLRTRGCKFGQGHFFSEPVPEGALPALFERFQ